MTQTVVITGASAGIGRATARLFGERGAKVGLIARGSAGLDAAALEVELAGGKALPVAADVADFDAVDAAATQIETELGPIDVWVNVAFTSVFAPFEEISAAEFRRVTEVSYLGFVHGTMAALGRMRARDEGVIVQVGSALGERSIPTWVAPSTPPPPSTIAERPAGGAASAGMFLTIGIRPETFPRPAGVNRRSAGSRCRPMGERCW